MPHEAIHSKLSSQNITEVVVDDLAYFRNLISIDLSDNQVQMEWLCKLENVEEMDLQNNSLTSLNNL